MTAVALSSLLAPLVESVSWAANVSLYLGKISYSVYLFHMIVAQLLHPVSVSLALVWQLMIYVACISSFCTLFYLAFERPILAARPAYGPLLNAVRVS